MYGSVTVLVIGESNSQMVSLSDELSQKNEELLRHQEEIAQLLSQIVELQHRVKEVGWPTAFRNDCDNLKKFETHCELICHLLINELSVGLCVCKCSCCFSSWLWRKRS